MTADYNALAREIRLAILPQLPGPVIPIDATPVGTHAIRWSLAWRPSRPLSLNGDLSAEAAELTFEALTNDSGSDYPETSYDTLRAITAAGIPAWPGLIEPPELTLSAPLSDSFEAWRWIETTLVIEMEVT